MPERDPNPTRRYFSHMLDSSRWSAIPLRGGDIIVSTSGKTGTTWVQRIVSVLIHGEHLPGALSEIHPGLTRDFSRSRSSRWLINWEHRPFAAR